MRLTLPAQSDSVIKAESFDEGSEYVARTLSVSSSGSEMYWSGGTGTNKSSPCDAGRVSGQFKVYFLFFSTFHTEWEAVFKK